MNRPAASVYFSTVIDLNGIKCFLVKPIAIGFSIALIAAACAREKRPSDVFDQKRMVEIMVDVHLAEGAEKTDLLTTDSVRISEKALCKHIFKKHGITEEEYNRSFTWYSEHLEEFDEVYVKVIEKLNQMEAARQQLRNR